MCIHSPGEVDSDWSPAVLDTASDIPYSSTVVYHNSIYYYIYKKSRYVHTVNREMFKVK